LSFALSGNKASLFRTLKRVAESRQKEEILSFLAWLELFLWELFCLQELRLPRQVVSLDLKPEFEKALRQKAAFPLLAALRELGQTRQDLERNVSFRLALFYLFIRMMEPETKRRY
jgi:hypothetical protein